MNVKVTITGCRSMLATFGIKERISSSDNSEDEGETASNHSLGAADESRPRATGYGAPFSMSRAFA